MTAGKGLLSNNHYVFVYGTLKQGQPNHSVMSQTKGRYRFISRGQTVEHFPLVVGTLFNIPFILNQRGSGKQVQGELYEVDNEKLVILDELEAHPFLYERTLEKIKVEGSNEVTESWIYIIHRWRDDFLSETSIPMENYSTLGDHARPYLDRYVREKLMNAETTNLFVEIMGFDPREGNSEIGVGKIPEETH